ncbi:MAG: S41 family peptidase [Flavobacteriaceae bacterium]|nr:S41 family peptidase [Flavobacteriaceae bacterium]
MKRLVLMSITILTLFFISCTNNDDTFKVSQELEVHDFVWKGINLFYFWQADVPNLKDDKFANQDQLNSFLTTYTKPEDLFDDLLFDTQNTDKWSRIVDDYIALEQQFQGISKNNGVEFGLVRLSGSNDVFGYVRYILPNSDASNKNIKRGDLFLEVDGQQINIDNFRSLLFSENNSYILSLASISGGTISLTGETVALTKEVYTENPVFLTKTFDIAGKKIGYLMYNAFISDFDQQLNEAFAQLKTEGVTDLILDLRYNGGGRVRTAVYLASMVTGQFNGELFTRERWNAKLQEAIEKDNPARLIDNFTNEILNKDSDENIILQEPINSLNLTKLYILVTGSSASASELVINGLNPYIDVKLIGTKTVGKYVASVTLYDSANFGRNGANPNHRYAMQPIVLEELNKLGVNDKDGFEPDINLPEDLANMGVLGEESDPLLERALNEIAGITIKYFRPLSKFSKYEKIINSKEVLPFSSEMYVSKDKEFYEFLKEKNNYLFR